jgi:CheY-like chemotaxis protein
MIARVRQTLGEEFDVVGAVEDGKQAVNAVLTLNPDVLVIDISMPVLNGLHAAKQLQTADYGQTRSNPAMPVKSHFR